MKTEDVTLNQMRRSEYRIPQDLVHPEVEAQWYDPGLVRQCSSIYEDADRP